MRLFIADATHPTSSAPHPPLQIPTAETSPTISFLDHNPQSRIITPALSQKVKTGFSPEFATTREFLHTYAKKDYPII